MNENQMHGPSVVKLIPTTDDHRAALSDPTSEIVYVAEELFEDGYQSLNVCWRPPQKAGQPKAEVPTYLTRVLWTTP